MDKIEELAREYAEEERVRFGQYSINKKLVGAFLDGWDAAIKQLNSPVKPIIKDYYPSECPTCKEDFSDYEPCNDGYYKRAYTLERCPYCGQKLIWK